MSEAILESPPSHSTTLLDILETQEGYERLVKRLKPLPHPVVPIPDREFLCDLVKAKGDEELVQFFQRRDKAIDLERSNPIYFGYESEQWKDADELVKQYDIVLATGAKRSSKTEWRAKRSVQNLEKHAGWKSWLLSTSNETSIRDQQQYIWKYLPYHWKKSAERRNWSRQKDTRILYTAAKGFSDRVLTTPNGGECRFMNYQQDKQVVEGGRIHEWWADEEIPPEWITALRWRTIDWKGKGIITYTSDRGFTPTLAEFFTGSKVLKSMSSPFSELQNMKLWPGLPHGHVPYILECLNPRHAVIFFQAFWNPYVPWDEFQKSLEGLALHVKALRAHGVTQKISGSCFPRFGKHNIVPHEKVIEEINTGATRYHVLDFAWNRNWAMLWFAVKRWKGKKRIFVYREWPDYESYGEWVVPSDKPDGARGPAQNTMGYGIADYKRLILSLESAHSGVEGEPEAVYARYGDPKSGATASMQEEGAATIFQMLEGGESGLEPMIIEPVAGKEGANHILEGVNLINQWLEYDPDKPIDAMNEPILYVSSQCQNLIDCLKMWSGRDGDRGASKDFIDLLRYAAIMDIDYVDQSVRFGYGGGSY